MVARRLRRMAARLDRTAYGRPGPVPNVVKVRIVADTADFEREMRRAADCIRRRNSRVGRMGRYEREMTRRRVEQHQAVDHD